jgi:hypothetical protein
MHPQLMNPMRVGSSPTSWEIDVVTTAVGAAQDSKHNHLRAVGTAEVSMNPPPIFHSQTFECSKICGIRFGVL